MSLTNEYNNNNLIIQSRDSTEIRPVRSMTCYICFENISTMQKQFGLQNNCDHFFCFDCLSTWRHTGDKETGGRCPLCRIRSTFIAPSWRCFNNTDDKHILIDMHKLRLKRIPCRVLSRYGYCRFGHRCYYNHNISLSTSRRWSSSNEPSRRITSNSHRYRPY